MTEEQIAAAMVRWLSGATTLTVIQDHQSGPRPAQPYAMLNFLGLSEVREHPQDVDWLRHQDGPGGESNRSTATPIIETEWRFSAHVYGIGGAGYLRRVRSHFHLAQANEPLMPAVILSEISQIRNVPEFINGGWEPRAQMDIFARGLTRDGVLVDTIETPIFEFTRLG